MCFDHTYLRGLDIVSDVLRLVYYDHRHNGRSGRPPVETLSHAQLAADAEGLRKLLGLGKVVVLGHSYGGFIALEYALRHPDSVSHLIPQDTAPQFN
jgi:proline iminopeptidase